MNAYLLTASVTRTHPESATMAQHARTSCFNMIVCAADADEAQKRFEESVCAPPEGESKVETQIHKIVIAPLVDQLLTETESAPLDWPQIAMQAQADMESVPADDFDQGYWLDANEVFGPSTNLDEFRQDLPEDIRSGLNWAEDKKFFFLLSVLSPPPPPPAESADDVEGEESEDSETSEETASGAAFNPGDSEADFPELVAKEAAVLIRARNAAVAAWLWRKYASNKELAGNQIRLDPWCGVVGPAAKGEAEGAIEDKGGS